MIRIALTKEVAQLLAPASMPAEGRPALPGPLARVAPLLRGPDTRVAGALPPNVTREGSVLVVRKVTAAALEQLLELWCLAYRDDLPATACPAWTTARYRRERSGPNIVETWKRPRDLRSSGVGDCDEFAIDEVVLLRKQGMDARPAVISTRPGYFHALVRAGEDLRDPSRAAVAVERSLYRKK